MSRWIACLLGLWGFCAVVAAAGEGSPFVDVVQAALRKNPRTLAAMAQLQAARERLPQSRAALLPAIDLNATRTSSSTRWDHGRVGSDPLSAGLSLTQTVFNQRSLLGIEQAWPYITAFEYDLQAAIQSVFLETASVIVEMLQAQEVLRLAENNRDLLKHHLVATRSRFDVGEITRTDVSHAESRLASAEANLVHSANALAVSRARFQELTGEAVPAGLAFPDLSAVVRDLPVAELQERGEQRPDLLAARLRQRVADMEVDMRRVADWPTVSLSAKANRNWNDESVGGSDTVNKYEVDLGLTLPLYTGGLNSSQISESLARREAQSAEVERLHRLMLREVEAAALDLKSATAAESAFQTALHAARETLDGVEREFGVGTRTALDLLDAQNELFSAQTELAKSRFSIVLSRFRLLSAMGLLTLEFGEELRQAGGGRQAATIVVADAGREYPAIIDVLTDPASRAGIRLIREERMAVR